jgi:group I intron endonuclease
MLNNWYVYRHRRLDNFNIFYVGIGKTTNFGRAFSKNQRSFWWKNVTKTTEYAVEILCINLAKEEASELEQFLIKEYGRKDLGLGNLINMTDGGDGAFGRPHTPESKAKISSSNKGREGKFGKDNPNYGKKHSEESLLKMSKIKTGKIRTESSKKKQSENLIKQYLLGKEHPLKGKKLTDLERRIISDNTKGGKNPRAREVIDVESGIVYSCIKEAAEAFGIEPNNLRRYLNPNSSRKNKTNLKYA